MTNFKKLIRWDADYYKLLSEKECTLCLTEREVYLLSECIHAIRWIGTRWIGDITGIDFDKVASDLQYKLEESVSCQKITQLAEQMNSLQLTVNNLNNTLNNYVDPAPDAPPITQDTVLSDAMPASDLTSHGTTIDGCDNDDKDALYGAISQVVRYIHEVNMQILIDLGQSAGNIVEQSQTLLGAFPPTDLVAADDLTKYINFLIDELKEEYESTVDEELLQTTICDLFCIAVANGCNTNMYDIFNYFGSKLDPTFTNFASTYLQIVQFAAIGSFTGDMYFHYMCYFQLASVAIGQATGFDTQRNYDLQIAAGQNSPDNDWTLFCDECPALYRLYEWDFTKQGQGDSYKALGFNVSEGTFVAGSGWFHNPSNSIVTIGIDLPIGIDILSFGIQTNVAPSQRTVEFRVTKNSSTGGQGANMTSGAEYNSCANVAGAISSNKVEWAIRMGGTTPFYIEKIAFVSNTDIYILGAISTEVDEIC